MQIRAGTSGWSYAAWKGPFYPADLPPSRMLSSYAEHFDAVEVNATYYRMPRPAMLEGWRGDVPDGFRFALKAPLRLAARTLAGREVATFTRTAAALGSRLGPLLFRPPPGAPDAGWVRDLLALVPSGVRAVVELREPAWHRDDVVTAIAVAGAALCTTDTDEAEGPLVPTASFGYLRLRRADYDAAALARWAARISGQPWKEAFVFFRHEDEARGPRLARALLETLAGERRAHMLAARESGLAGEGRGGGRTGPA